MIVDRMCQSVSSIMKKIHKCPFNLELKNGSLPKDKFIFYLVQDAIYLADFSRALAMTAVKLDDKQQMKQLIGFAQAAMLAERECHLKYIQAHSSEQLLLVEPSPACFMYTNYLLKMASTATVEEAVASLLPCFYVYHEVGKQMALFCHNPHHPYLDWITIYSSKEFESSVQAAIGTVNQLGANGSSLIKDKMLNAFIRSTKLEFLFWDSAYRKEQWLV
jgi:thiaminase (transcriptional activator TenA)